ncbi:hypothetical protein TGAM01_v201249 [Trichoderma gamsii]|uniref:Dynactin subunit 4 n=1 Tax=Trichoderma gamsii TaxID=398673 RepID=A0A2P5A041_9HYPO|nr:hypothetical protein TGAM01_v201249 [Trichoderma gamsii]PON29883.1 hypothetical protein TGAM01_v201249 [Trichoderma gamsii]
MSLSTPYTYIQCPCSDQTVLSSGNAEEDERTFDPKAPRSNYSLYPLEYLLYCEDCQQIRCPRCVTEESVTYYCPNCLFEVPSSNLRSEVCIGPLQVGAIQPTTDANLLPTQYQTNPTGGPYALFCQYCNWTSTEIGIEFDRPSGIYNQLSKINNGGKPKLTLRDVKDRRKDNPDEPPVPDDQVDADLQFANLKAFYQSRLSETNTSIRGLPLHDGLGFSSPAALTRIMSLYTGRGHQGRLQQGPADIMREALGTNDGLKIANLDESKEIKKLISGGWDATASLEQRKEQTEPIQFEDELRPIAYLLRSKRSKRCPACRHIISKPEAKVTSTRFKIRLVAKSYIPTITIRPLNPTAAPAPVTYRPMVKEEAPLKPHQPYHFVVTFKNPLFDNIKVTLASPNATPGRFSSRVTVLCPQFEVDANTDMWDDALKDDEKDRSRKADEGPEVGKIWEKGRNWVSIVLEVIPASLRIDHLPRKGNEKIDTSPLKSGEDILEIPMFVRMEWEADTQADMDDRPSKDNKETREKRELAYWCVLGVGRISRD